MKNVFRSHRRQPHQHDEQQQAKPFFDKGADLPNRPFFSKSGGLVQTKLTVGQPGDAFEREADSVADAVVQNNTAGPAPVVQAKGISRVQRALASAGTGSATAEERVREDKLIQEKRETGIQKMEKPMEEDEALKPPALQKMEMPAEDEEMPGAAPAVMTKPDRAQTASPGVSSRIESSKGAGSPLPDAARAEMESSFGYDFSGVHIHTGQEAETLNQDLQAQAFTYGQDVYFNAGKFSPETKEGKRLLAHELTHTIQQGAVQPGSEQKPFPVQRDLIQRNDAAFESGSGVGSAITSGTMTADGIMGNTYTANNCRGVFGCNVGFNFEKAYKGAYPYRAAGRDVKGVYVKIASVYDHGICGACDSIRLIQTIRYFQKGTTGNIETAEPTTDTRRQRTGWNDPNAPSRGWMVDQLDSDTVPFYDTTPHYDSQIGNPTQPAILWDSPGHWTNVINHGKEFQTFFVCETNAGSNRITIGGVNWGYYTDNSGNINFLPAAPIPTCGATRELQDSASRWDSIAGNQATGIDFSGEPGIAHDADRLRIWFNLDSTMLRNDASAPSDANYAQALRFIRQHIVATSPLTRIILHGYSSTDGDARYNLGLSRRRAEAIKARLVADGIPESMLELQAHGENAELSPKEMNRRVEIQMTRWTLNDILNGIRNFLFGQ